MKLPDGDLRLLRDSCGASPGGDRYLYELVSIKPGQDLEFLSRTGFVAVSGSRA